MKKLILGVMTMSIISMLTGCRATETEGTKAAKPISEKPMFEEPISEEPITIDYADYPHDFMIRLVAGQKYILKNGEASIDFCAKSNSTEESDRILEYGECKADISDAVYYGETKPVLIHYNDRDYVWICEQRENNEMLQASVYYFTQPDSLGSDNFSLNLKFDEDILDPSDFVMVEFKDCFGMVLSTIHYRIGESGKPEEIETDDKYYSIEEQYSKELLRLDTDIHTWVYANADTEEYTFEEIPAGTTFYRLRVPKDDEYSYAEGILEDGRVFRVIEEEKFSEPTSYMEMRDMDDHKFEYSVVTDGE